MPPSPRTLRVLLAGVSGRGTWPLEHCLPETGFEIAALFDLSAEALAAARLRTGLPESACFTDLARAIAEVPADGLIICTPTRTHVPFARLGLDAGLAVLTEKGMAPTFDEARRLVAHAGDRDGVLCVAQNYRYQPLERAVSAAIRDPASPYHPGPVWLVEYTQQRVRPQPRTLDYPFASVWDMSCHHFDTLLGWLGPVESVDARAFAPAWSAYPHPNNTSARLTFRSGATVHYLHTHDAAAGSLRVEVHGERGVLVHAGAGLAFHQRPLENFGTSPALAVPLPAGDPLDLLLADFHSYATTGAEPGISGRNNLEVMAVCELVVRSATERRTVRREEL